MLLSNLVFLKIFFVITNFSTLPYFGNLYKPFDIGKKATQIQFTYVNFQISEVSKLNYNILRKESTLIFILSIN